MKKMNSDSCDNVANCEFDTHWVLYKLSFRSKYFLNRFVCFHIKVKENLI